MQQLLDLLHAVAEHQLQLLLLQSHKFEFLALIVALAAADGLALEGGLRIGVADRVVLAVAFALAGQFLLDEVATVEGGVPEDFVLLLELLQDFNLVGLQLLEPSFNCAHLAVLRLVLPSIFARIRLFLLVTVDMLIGVAVLAVAAPLTVLLLAGGGHAPLQVSPVLLLRSPVEDSVGVGG